ncbi:MAG: SPOR domain-containing protein [Gammaproteobacteria bacterium]|nr:SPOR domain-containing protein [Gammaproteobacteria bacterium]
MNITENSNSSKYNKTGYYLTPDLSQRLDLISHLLANTQLVPFVQAAEGCGKTRLTQHLADTLAERYTVFLIEGESGISKKGLRSQLSEATGAAPHEVIDDEQLAGQIKALNEQNKTLLFLVDDAEQLPADTLTWLVEIITGQEEAFYSKCVIFAAVDVLALPLSPVLLSILNDTIQILDIPLITPEQLPGFVASVDPLKSAVIDGTQYAALMKNSAGVIGKILWQLQYVENTPMPQQETGNSPANKMKPWYVVAGILFVSALASVLIFQDEINLNLREAKTVARETELEVITLPLPPPVVAVQENDTLRPSPLPEPKPEPETEKDKFASKVTEQSDPDVVVVEKVVNDNQPVLVSGEDQNELKIEPEAKPEDKTSSKQVDRPQIVQKETEMPVSVEAPKVTEKLTASVTKPEPAKPVKPQKQGENIQTVDWIINQPDKSYTLQLLAVSDEKGIKRFLKLHNFSGNLVILKTKRNGKPWYALLFETYVSRDEALNARKNLPKSYKSSSAWPRSILSIRQAIEAN